MPRRTQTDSANPGHHRSTVAAFIWFVTVAGWMSLWVVTNPAGAAPDEPSHYAKSVAAGQGDLRGDAVPLDVIESFGVFNDDAIAQVRNSYRSFLLDAPRRSTTAPPCTAFRAEVDGTCLKRAVATPNTADAPNTADPNRSSRVESIVGAYPPWLYLPGGLLARLGGSLDSAYLLARLGSAAVCAGLFAAAGWLLVAGRARQTPVLLAGLALGCTPMMIFLSASTGANGPEAVGALASTAAALRLSARERPGRASWLVAGAVFAVTAASRPFAPLWVLLAVTIGVARLGPRDAVRRVRTGGAAAAVAVAATVVGAAGSLAWTQSMALRMPLSFDLVDDGLARAVELAPAMAGQAIGVLGWQELTLPVALRWAWGMALFAVVVAAVGRGRRRDAGATLVSVAALFVIYLLLAGTVFYQNGLGMQGRYILPALATVPLVAAAALADPRPPRRRGPARRPARVRPARARRGTPAYAYREQDVPTTDVPSTDRPATDLSATDPPANPAPATAAGSHRPDSHARRLTPALAGLAIALVGMGQAVAWAVNARRYAVGVDGPVWFLSSVPAWAPGGGWPLWTALAGVLVVLSATAGGIAVRCAPSGGPERPEQRSGPRPRSPLRMPTAVSVGRPSGVPGRPPDPRSAPPGAPTSPTTQTSPQLRPRPAWTPLSLPPLPIPPLPIPPLPVPPPRGRPAAETDPCPAADSTAPPEAAGATTDSPDSPDGGGATGGGTGTEPFATAERAHTDPHE